MEEGIALLISIFILLLISVVATALIVASGTESALAGNYRSSTGVYYAALAGLEEARGRLSPKSPNTLQSLSFFPSPGVTLPIGNVLYVLNPSPTESAANLLTTPAYQDNEYDTEFGNGKLAAAQAAGTVQTTLSVWNMAPLNGLGIPGPLYKWVRINAVSEVALNLLASPFNDPNDPTTPIFYDGTQLNVSNNGQQVLEITSLAVLPNGTQKVVQYLVTPTPLNLPNFPAALTLAGNASNTIGANSLNYGGPNSGSFYVNGTDSFRNPFGSCTPTSTIYAGIGYTNTHDNSSSNIDCCKVVTYKNNYIGTGGTTPNVLPVTMPPSLQTPTDYNNLVQSITQVADVILTPGAGTTPAPYTAYGTDVSTATPGMSNANPKTVVINGNLDLTAWHNQGYGLLVVTGNLTYDPDASWYGIVLVIGSGTINGYNNGVGEFDGAVLVAQTVNPSTGAPLASLGPAYAEYHSGDGGQGFYYSSCWINNAIPTGGYRILSFHETSQ